MLQLFLLVLRSLQLFCRLVLSLQPIPLKLPPAKVLTLLVALLKDTVVLRNSSRAAVKRAEDSALESSNSVGNACILGKILKYVAHILFMKTDIMFLVIWTVNVIGKGI